jgi:hypothetical protein
VTAAGSKIVKPAGIVFEGFDSLDIIAILQIPAVLGSVRVRVAANR